MPPTAYELYSAFYFLVGSWELGERAGLRRRWGGGASLAVGMRGDVVRSPIALQSRVSSAFRSSSLPSLVGWSSSSSSPSPESCVADGLGDCPLAGAHRDLAREAVRKSLVLLKNGAKADDPVLLLPKKADKILVAGTHANNLGNQCGGWAISWQGLTGNNHTT
ncbi:hypothetical protein Dimus_006052, partial [Dionaea muscipula]